MRNYVLKSNLQLFFWYNKSCWFLVKKYWCQKGSRGFSRKLYTFLIFFRSAEFHYCRICGTAFMEEGLCHPSPLPHSSVSNPKKTILNRVNNRSVNNRSVKISFSENFFFYFMGTNSLRTLFKQKFLHLLFSGERNSWCTLKQAYRKFSF